MVLAEVLSSVGAAVAPLAQSAVEAAMSTHRLLHREVFANRPMVVKEGFGAGEPVGSGFDSSGGSPGLSCRVPSSSSLFWWPLSWGQGW